MRRVAGLAASGVLLFASACRSTSRAAPDGVVAATTTVNRLLTPIVWSDEQIDGLVQAMESTGGRVDRACLVKALQGVTLFDIAPEADPDSPMYRRMFSCVTRADGTPWATGSAP